MILEYVKVFLVGGTICLIAQILMDYFKMQTPYVMVTYVTTGAALTFLGIYDKIVDFAAEGAMVPIIGFGYLLANGVIEGIIDWRNNSCSRRNSISDIFWICNGCNFYTKGKTLI